MVAGSMYLQGGYSELINDVKAQYSSVQTSYLLKSIRDTLYSGPVKRGLRAVGLEKPIRDIYRQLFLFLAEDQVRLKVNELESDFYITSYIELKRFRDFGGERAILEKLLAELEPDDTFYDIGANTGLYTCITGQKLADDGLVVAFEPHPANVARLEANIELNDISARVIDCALSDTDGSVNLSIDQIDGHQAGAGTHALTSDDGKEVIEVSTTTADSLVSTQSIPEPNIVKIDVEGAEMRVLRGMAGILSQKRCRAIYCEVHPERIENYGDSITDIRSLLTNYGFQIERLSERGDEYHLYASRSEGAD